MKKGLRRFHSRLHGGLFVRTVDLMKKGLRQRPPCASNLNLGQNRRPDEEGIKTSPDFVSWPPRMSEP